jgi:hypothetical protein
MKTMGNCNVVYDGYCRCTVIMFVGVTFDSPGPEEEPAQTVVLTTALTDLRKSELPGLTWDRFDGKELTVREACGIAR